MVFCKQGLSLDMNTDLTTNQVYDDYKKNFWTRVSYKMNYTQYIEIIISKLCTSVDSQPSVPDSQAHEAQYDAAQHISLKVSPLCYMMLPL